MRAAENHRVSLKGFLVVFVDSGRLNPGFMRVLRYPIVLRLEALVFGGRVSVELLAIVNLVDNVVMSHLRAHECGLLPRAVLA